MFSRKRPALLFYAFQRWYMSRFFPEYRVLATSNINPIFVDKKLDAWEIAEIYKQRWQIELLLTPTDSSIFYQKPRENYDLFKQGDP